MVLLGASAVAPPCMLRSVKLPTEDRLAATAEEEDVDPPERTLLEPEVVFFLPPPPADDADDPPPLLKMPLRSPHTCDSLLALAAANIWTLVHSSLILSSSSLRFSL